MLSRDVTEQKLFKLLRSTENFSSRCLFLAAANPRPLPQPDSSFPFAYAPRSTRFSSRKIRERAGHSRGYFSNHYPPFRPSRFLRDSPSWLLYCLTNKVSEAGTHPTRRHDILNVPDDATRLFASNALSARLSTRDINTRRFRPRAFLRIVSPVSGNECTPPSRRQLEESFFSLREILKGRSTRTRLTSNVPATASSDICPSFRRSSYHPVEFSARKCRKLRTATSFPSTVDPAFCRRK